MNPSLSWRRPPSRDIRSQARWDLARDVLALFSIVVAVAFVTVALWVMS